MMITPKIIVLPILAAVTTYVIMPMVRRLSQEVGAVAIPGKRKVHKIITPSSGGVAIFLGFLIAVLFFNSTSTEIIGYLMGCAIITCIGLFDDIFDLPPIAKFFGQILAALIVIYSGVRIEFVGGLADGGLYYLGFLSLPFTFFWIVGITNAINFLDGIDGLAGGVSGIAAWTLAIVSLLSGRYDVAVLSFTLGAAAFAFLPYNFSDNPTKKIFMGDAGSNFLGYSLAVFSIMGMVKVAAAFSMLVPILILAVPIFDTGFAIVRRVMAGKSPFEADMMHLHHRIIDKGLNHRQTTFVIYAISIILGAISIGLMKMDNVSVVITFLSTIAFFLLVVWRLGIIKTKAE
jgi:UDP-GlcNAc:undecaprenyl-phosphate GlcNAc-1-phosphate transferase